MTDRSRKDKDLERLEVQVENMKSDKASKDYVIKSNDLVVSEIARVRDRVDTMQMKLDEVDERSSSPHLCMNEGSFNTLLSRIDANKTDINNNSSSIKKLYVWQATVGVSLLVFFLTVGVAALRYVDKIDFSVEKNSDTISRMEEAIKESTKNRNATISSTGISKQDLKDVLKDVLRDQ